MEMVLILTPMGGGGRWGRAGFRIQEPGARMKSICFLFSAFCLLLTADCLLGREVGNQKEVLGARSLSEIDFRFRGEGGASFIINHLV
jgi:hypothetical protein